MFKPQGNSGQKRSSMTGSTLPPTKSEREYPIRLSKAAVECWMVDGGPALTGAEEGDFHFGVLKVMES